MGYPYYVWLCADTCRHTANCNLPSLFDKACYSISVSHIAFYRRYDTNRCNGDIYYDFILNALNKMKTENLMFSHLGNGVTVCDVNNNYVKVAHIAYTRCVTYYMQDLSDGAKLEIEDLATYGNLAVSATQPDAYALCPLIFN